MNYNPLPAIPRITHAPKKSNHPVGRTVMCVTKCEVSDDNSGTYFVSNSVL